MIVDCVTCPVSGQRCDDCVVMAMFSPSAAGLSLDAAELSLDAAESIAVGVFVGAGMVSAETVAGLYARREPWGDMGAVG